MAIYMNYNKLAVKGSVTAKGYENWIELDGMSKGHGRAVSMDVGAMANREASLPMLSEMSISKRIDAASAGLYKDSLGGDVGVPVEIHIVQTGAKGVEKYAEFKLDSCMISSWSIDAANGSAPSESISLSFAKVEADLTHADKTNKNTKNVKVGFCLEKGTAL
ncbi:Hcp family type VI secretion system effector [Marinibactrum halimedae]|uniref:Type VI secretion system tube protein Hcp n=1 Tax=Marinibactrum halimedae TaxID=1444977 RepID=A0AA37T112_9GAMM|nr:type VI secretion system tube protein Hcp [Marinibactrum halimedae]MCD9457639.1 type VI secretion system tube protein Hcp [Marinibactrum halimedae]GLS24989.1 hypothetical protein GCM10007877_07030 [Marinibactrum halimedae]